MFYVLRGYLKSFLNKRGFFVDMKKSFGEVVDRVVRNTGVVLEVIDARFAEQTRNFYLESLVRKKKGVLIIVVNKSDTVTRKEIIALKKTLKGAVFVSSTKQKGVNLIKDRIRKEARRRGMRNVVAGVVGYPNVGKSSLINALKGRRSAKTSPEAGFTKGMQLLKISRDIMVFDTPGVIPMTKKDESKLVLVGAKNPSLIKDPDLAVVRLIRKYPGAIEKHYGVDSSDDKEKTIEQIALKFNMMLKKGEADIERASIRILRDWQKGVIRTLK